MIVVGAGGFAKEIIEILIKNDGYDNSNLFIFEEIDKKKSSFYGFKILQEMDEVKKVFDTLSPDFCLGVGTVIARYNLCKKFENSGGNLVSVVSSNSSIGKYDVKIGNGTCVMSSSTISNGVSIGKGVLVNADVLAGHDVTIGDFSDISPGVKLTGHSMVGRFVTIGTSAVILPGVKIGDNSMIAAGSVVSNDIPNNSMVVGIVPSRIVKKLPEFEE